MQIIIFCDFPGCQIYNLVLFILNSEKNKKDNEIAIDCYSVKNTKIHG